MYKNLFHLALMFCILPTTVLASNKVSSPDITAGRTDLEYRFGRDFDKDSERDDRDVHRFIVNYGLNDCWRMEGKIILNDNRNDYDFTYLEYSNRFQLIEDGSAWPRLSLQVNYNHALQPTDPDSLEYTILAGKNFGRFTHLTNINLESEGGEYRSEGVNLTVSWKSRYELSELIEPGFEIYADLGRIDKETAPNSKRSFVGPTISGRISDIRYDTGLLFGVTENTPSARFKLILTHSF